LKPFFIIIMSNETSSKVDARTRVDPEKSAMGLDDESDRAASVAMASADITGKVVDPALAMKTQLVNEVRVPRTDTKSKLTGVY
jgi:hypothetical protein